MSAGWTHQLVDPVLLQAEKVFLQRQARSRFLDADLLGEPGWDILLCAFVAAGNERKCRIEDLAGELNLSIAVTERWVRLLIERDLLDESGDFIAISRHGDAIIRRMFRALMRDNMQELGGEDGVLFFCGGEELKNG